MGRYRSGGYKSDNMNRRNNSFYHVALNAFAVQSATLVYVLPLLKRNKGDATIYHLHKKLY